MAPTGGDGDEPAPVELGVDVELLVGGIDRLRVGQYPHLHEMHVAVAARVHLRVPDAPPGAHPLGQPRIDEALVSGGVLVLELAVEDPGDDLHVAVGMRGEARPGPHPVVVADQQQPVVGVLGVVVPGEAEAVLRVEPGDVSEEALVRPADVDRHGQPPDTIATRSRWSSSQYCRAISTQTDAAASMIVRSKSAASRAIIMRF